MNNRRSQRRYVFQLLIFSISFYSFCRPQTKSPSVIAMEHCQGLSGKVLNDCWERDMLRQIKEAKDQETICHGYLALAEFYIDEARLKSAEGIYADLRSGRYDGTCKSYAETANNAYKTRQPGQKAPQIKAFDSNNQRIDTEQINNRGIILFFWASWCGACKQDYADLSEIHRGYVEKVAVIGISGDTDREEFETTLREKAIRWPNIQDGNNYEGYLNRQFFVNRYPTIILIDRHGRMITDRLRGEALRKFIQKL